jgi:hypothetical protein
MSGKSCSRNGRFRTLAAGSRRGVLPNVFCCSAARGPAQDLDCERLGPLPPARAKPHSNACAASHAVPLLYFAAVLSAPAVRILLLTSGAKGTRTLTPACKVGPSCRVRSLTWDCGRGASAGIGSCRILLWSGLVVSLPSVSAGHRPSAGCVPAAALGCCTLIHPQAAASSAPRPVQDGSYPPGGMF